MQIIGHKHNADQRQRSAAGPHGRTILKHRPGKRHSGKPSFHYLEVVLSLLCPSENLMSFFCAINPKGKKKVKKKPR
jgi:hypothetical protein